jgi:hypothetical protein
MEGPSSEGSITRGGAIKDIWYFPIALRVYRLFVNAKSAKLLCWHGEERKNVTINDEALRRWEGLLDDYLYYVL